MKEYIEREAAILALGDEPVVWDDYDMDGRAQSYAWSAHRRGIERVPAADVAPVRHGRWIFKEDDKMPWCTQAICSECGAVVENNSHLSTPDLQQYFVGENKYCRRCSARMDKGGCEIEH